SSAISQVVNVIPTTTTVSGNPNPSNSGQSVTITATVTPESGGAPTGTVTFSGGLGTATLVNGAATVSTSFTAQTTITATYNPDSTHGNSSGSYLQTVGAIATTTALSGNPNPSVSGQPVTFTATVTPASGGTPTGSVNFLDGTTTIGN